MICALCSVSNPSGTLFCLACAGPLSAAPVAVAAPPVVARSARLVALENLMPTGWAVDLPDTAWEGTLLVGRNDLAAGTVVDIDLTAHGGREKHVSRRHARLEFQGGLIRLSDWESAHGTLLNKQRLGPGQAEVLADGDELRLASFVFRVEIR